MAEIKSAIELAMEKTKGLHLSREEKEKLKEEELHSKAHSLVNRFLEIDFHLKEVEKELAKHDPDQRTQMENLMVQYLAEALQLDRDNEPIFQGIETLREGRTAAIGKIRSLIQAYRERKEKEFLKVQRDLLEGLEGAGISGTAVQPKVQGTPEWAEIQSQFQPDFQEQLNLLRKELILLP